MNNYGAAGFVAEGSQSLHTDQGSSDSTLAKPLIPRHLSSLFLLPPPEPAGGTLFFAPFMLLLSFQTIEGSPVTAFLLTPRQNGTLALACLLSGTGFARCEPSFPASTSEDTSPGRFVGRGSRLQAAFEDKY
jgi:hypothetical protein